MTKRCTHPGIGLCQQGNLLECCSPRRTIDFCLLSHVCNIYNTAYRFHCPAGILQTPENRFPIDTPLECRHVSQYRPSEPFSGVLVDHLLSNLPHSSHASDGAVELHLLRKEDPVTSCVRPDTSLCRSWYGFILQRPT